LSFGPFAMELCEPDKAMIGKQKGLCG